MLIAAIFHLLWLTVFPDIPGMLPHQAPGPFSAPAPLQTPTSAFTKSHELTSSFTPRHLSMSVLDRLVLDPVESVKMSDPQGECLIVLPFRTSPSRLKY